MEPPAGSSGDILFDLIIIAGSILAVAVLSAAELSFISVNKIRIRSLLERGDKRAQAVLDILERHDTLFSAVILSGNLFTVLATSMGTALSIREFGPEWGIAIATIAMTFLTVVIGELTPKTFAVTHSERLSLVLARPVALYIKAIYPLIWVFHKASSIILKVLGQGELKVTPHVTEEEIRTVITMGEEEGAIEEEEKQMLHRVLEFAETQVSEAMVPRTEMAVIQASTTVAEALKFVAEKGYSRYPVIGENIDDTKGVLYIKDLMITMSQTEISGLPVEHFMREAYYIPMSKTVSDLLDDMRKSKVHIALVMDEYGGTAGLVTMEDIMEELVGSLQDEFESLEAEKDVEILDEHTFVVAGHAPLDEVSETIGQKIESEDFNTIGGYIFGLFGRLPRVGEQALTQNLRLVVMEMEDKKVAKVKITKL